MGLDGSNLILFKNRETGWISILALFGSKLESSIGSRITDITLNGEDPILPMVAKITLIVPRGGLEEASSKGPN